MDMPATIVNNESSEIIRIFYDAFDKLLPSEKREESKGEAAFLPPHLAKDIDAMNEWVYDAVNNGVYKTGFATSQQAYNEHVSKLFQSLDRLETHLGEPGHHPYLFGQHITEADIRLYTTLIRFDAAYYTLFKCNIKMIRLDYPRLHEWLRRLYWDESERTSGGVFKKTTNFDVVSIR
jgi:putative glutathione S-transferase